ncbi:hypothetical protein HDV02_005729, partial [Globomyces sp. JEL0801]
MLEISEDLKKYKLWLDTGVLTLEAYTEAVKARLDPNFGCSMPTDGNRNQHNISEVDRMYLKHTFESAKNIGKENRGKAIDKKNQEEARKAKNISNLPITIEFMKRDISLPKTKEFMSMGFFAVRDKVNGSTSGEKLRKYVYETYFLPLVQKAGKFDFPELEHCELVYDKEKAKVAYDFATYHEAIDDGVSKFVFCWTPTKLSNTSSLKRTSSSTRSFRTKTLRLTQDNPVVYRPGKMIRDLEGVEEDCQVSIGELVGSGTYKHCYDISIQGAESEWVAKKFIEESKNTEKCNIFFEMQSLNVAAKLLKDFQLLCMDHEEELGISLSKRVNNWKIVPHYVLELD